MSRLKKTIDGNNRVAKKLRPKRARRKHVVTKKTSTKQIGRPKIDVQQLLPRRDEVLHLLCVNWERIGWRLSCARTPKALRKALRPLGRQSSLSYWVAPFLRESTEKASAVQIRATSKLLSPEVENNRTLQERLNLLSQRFDAVQSVFNPELENSKANIVAELKKRGDEFEECERALFASNCKIKDLELKITDERAFFVQNELLRFKKRGYAHNPKVLTNATAGLPEIGCRHSFRICSRTDPHAWPFYRFQVFEFFCRVWESHKSGCEQSPTDLFRERIIQLPRKVEVAREIVLRYKLKSKFQDSYLRLFLCENWRFLRLAIEQICRHRILAKVVPYLITAKFYAGLGKPRTAQDEVLTEMEMLSE